MSINLKKTKHWQHFIKYISYSMSSIYFVLFLICLVKCHKLASHEINTLYKNLNPSTEVSELNTFSNHIASGLRSPAIYLRK